MRRTFNALGLAVLPSIFLAGLPAVGARADEQQETDPLVLKKLQWFQDLKFGLFMHWGIYSQWGSIKSWPLVEVDRWARPDDLRAWTDRNKDFARFSRDYRALNRSFNPRHFDPQRWVEAAKYAGMRYVVFTTKHHDGFAMFDTRQSDFRVTAPACPFHASPRANVAREVFDAFRGAGFGIGAYYSKSDWTHPGYWVPEWPHPDRNVNYDIRKFPAKWAAFVSYTHAQVEELMSGYGPIDILWLDGGQVRPPQQDIDMPRLAAMARRHQPGLLVVDRTVGGRYENYRTPEQEVPPSPLPYAWESCLTMGDQWSFKPDDRYKSTRKLIHLLVGIVAKGGNFLLERRARRRRRFLARRLPAAPRDGRLDAGQRRGDLRHPGDRPLPARPRLPDPQERFDLCDLPRRRGPEGSAGRDRRAGDSRRTIGADARRVAAYRLELR